MTTLKDRDGKDSSKRICGVSLIFAGGVLLVAMGIYGFFASPPGLEAIKYAGLTLVSGGAGLLGFGTLAERVNK